MHLWFWNLGKGPSWRECVWVRDPVWGWISAAGCRCKRMEIQEPWDIIPFRAGNRPGDGKGGPGGHGEGPGCWPGSGREVPQWDLVLRPSQALSGAACGCVGRRPGLTIDLHQVGIADSSGSNLNGLLGAAESWESGLWRKYLRGTGNRAPDRSLFRGGSLRGKQRMDSRATRPDPGGPELQSGRHLLSESQDSDPQQHGDSGDWDGSDVLEQQDQVGPWL